MKYVRKFICSVIGHSMFSVFKLDNSTFFDGQPRSSWGLNRCTRCGYEDHWQWDHY